MHAQIESILSKLNDEDLKFITSSDVFIKYINKKSVSDLWLTSYIDSAVKNALLSKPDMRKLRLNISKLESLNCIDECELLRLRLKEIIDTRPINKKSDAFKRKVKADNVKLNLVRRALSEIKCPVTQKQFNALFKYKNAYVNVNTAALEDLQTYCSIARPTCKLVTRERPDLQNSVDVALVNDWVRRAENKGSLDTL